MEVLFFFADRIYYNYPNSFLFTSSVICRRYSLNSYSEEFLTFYLLNFLPFKLFTF